MDNKNNKYWFQLNSETFLWKTTDKVLLYNTDFQKSLVFKNNGTLNKLVAQLQDINNLYCLELSKTEINSSDISFFIKGVVHSGFCNLQNAKRGVKKPVSLVPVLKLQDKMKKSDRFVKSNNNMLSYLHEVDIYINEQQRTINKSSANSTKIVNIVYDDLLKFLGTIYKS